MWVRVGVGVGVCVCGWVCVGVCVGRAHVRVCVCGEFGIFRNGRVTQIGGR